MAPYLIVNWCKTYFLKNHKALWSKVDFVFVNNSFQHFNVRKIHVSKLAWPFKRQSHKMVKHTQTIRRQIANELFECVWLFCEIGT